MRGWIKLHRSLLDWEWYDDANAMRLLIHLLLSVNYEHKRWRGIVIPAGSMVVSWESLSKKSGLTVRQCRTAIKKLENSGEVTRKSTNKNQTVTLVKWEQMQGDDKQNGKPSTSKRQANDKQTTTTKESKELKEPKKEVDSVPDSDQAAPSKMDLFLTWYNEIRKEYLPKSRGITAWTDKAKRNFKKTKGKGYTKGDIKHAIRAAFDDPNHRESKWHYVTVEFITREDILQRYVHTEGASREKAYTEMTPAEKAAKYID